MRIGNRIRDRRTLLKMSADELAKRIGKDRSTVYRYESGDIDKISVDMLKPLAEALETTPAYLLGMEMNTGELAATNVVSDDVCATYISTNTIQVRHMEEWVKELGHVEMTEEENAEIIKFAKYLLFRRTLQ